MNPKKDESVNENEFSFGSIGENCKNIAKSVKRSSDDAKCKEE